MLKLYSYWRSSASFRVRIALNLKGLEYATLPVDLVAARRAAGDRPGTGQFDADLLARNPDALVPLLIDGEQLLHQSLAIIEYLEETRPQPPLLPAGRADRAWVRALAQQIACEIHPLGNLRVLRYLKGGLGVAEADRDAWYRHWIALGFEAIEARLTASPRAGEFCFGDAPGLADVFLVPQVFNGMRVDLDFGRYPRLVAIYERCMALDAFRLAAPPAQPDAPADTGAASA